MLQHDDLRRRRLQIVEQPAHAVARLAGLETDDDGTAPEEARGADAIGADIRPRRESKDEHAVAIGRMRAQIVRELKHGEGGMLVAGVGAAVTGEVGVAIEAPQPAGKIVRRVVPPAPEVTDTPYGDRDQ